MKRISGSCTILLLGLAITLNVASAQETPGLEGVWRADITVTNCAGSIQRSVRTLEMYSHEGLVSGPGGTLPGSNLPLPRTSSVGTWRHLQAHTYIATQRFFGLNPDGTLASMVTAVRTIQLVDNDHFTGSDAVAVTALNGALLSTVCTIVRGEGLPSQ